MSRGAATIVVRGGRVLAVSRGANVADWGLPGGMVETSSGEPDDVAAARELWEETGVRVHPRSLVPVLRSGFVHRTVIFAAAGPVWIPEQLGQRADHWEGHVAWLRPLDFLTPSCTFRRDNRRAFARLGL